MADPRVKLEEALRRAGLHQNPYARVMLKDVKPLKPPRKDQESTVFKDVDKWSHQGSKSSQSYTPTIFFQKLSVSADLDMKKLMVLKGFKK